MTDTHNDPHHIVSPKTYLVIFTLLLVLMFATVAVAFVDLGAYNLVVAMGIATLKALLIILYFMHVRYSTSVVRLFVGIGFLWLIFFFVLTFGDYFARLGML